MDILKLKFVVRENKNKTTLKKKKNVKTYILL